ncbi:MAG: pilus assembly protein PilO [Synechococcales cyanobacterium M58_A2018_015]|nr:pilus assembly protein PilO [Synechococcales cyanobacterium M58_A2018_015]
MTIGGDFVPAGNSRELAGPTYPKVFGITITPTVGAILLALLGVAGAYVLWTNLVQGTLQRNRELKQDIAAKEAQLRDPEAMQQQIAEAKTRLQEAQQLQADVRSLFASESSMDTLLLDINERVQAVNAGITDPARRATLSKFELNQEASGPVTDGSLGAEVNNKLERRVYDVEIQGTFPQTQSIIRNIERLQPLLVVSEFDSTLDRASQKIVLDGEGRLDPGRQPDPRVITAFQLAALVPVDSPAPPPAVPDPNATPAQ